ncbi:hypothetical protein [Vibrio maritimus]|uniref:hypothetical protein n=1 Tax=Vibrio maritimus TaxID=990268 RepID=UPI003735D3CD
MVLGAERGDDTDVQSIGNVCGFLGFVQSAGKGSTFFGLVQSVGLGTGVTFGGAGDLELRLLGLLPNRFAMMKTTKIKIIHDMSTTL